MHRAASHFRRSLLPVLLLRIVFSSHSALNKVRFSRPRPACALQDTHSKGIHWVVGIATLASKVWARLLIHTYFFTSLPLSQRFCNTVPQLQHGLFIVPTAPAGFSGCSRPLNSNCVVSKDVPFGECRLCFYFAHAEYLLHFCHL